MTSEQHIHAIVDNAADRALSSRGYWLQPRLRTAIAETVLAALTEHDLVVVTRQDLEETLEDAHTFNDVMLGGDDAATARLDRLRAVLSGTLHPPQGSEIDSPVSGIQGPADTRTSPPSDRTSPLMRNADPTSNPRNPEAT